MNKYKRSDRVAALLQEEVSRYLLFELKNPDLDTVQGLIQAHNVAAVVTKEEHRQLGRVPGSRDDVWQRYRFAGIQWVDRSSA